MRAVQGRAGFVGEYISNATLKIIAAHQLLLNQLVS
jgi:hypothetical protein